ncbi:MAG: glucosaminidase domain-containing protein [Holosporaceae bacterium]|jgi:uncharacterized FlgJ-related protein|nr:glucosaminidase domain-containing protein [Holosporaceae bacterium]
MQFDERMRAHGLNFSRAALVSFVLGVALFHQTLWPETVGSSIKHADGSAVSPCTPESVRNDLFRCHVMDTSHDVVHHSILDGVDFSNHSHHTKIPSLALCSVRKVSVSNHLDREFFIKAIASAVKFANKCIREHRMTVLSVQKKRASNEPLQQQENDRFKKICYFYGSSNIGELLERVAPIPESLAVAQAALESGFGSNTVMHRNNAFFGMMKNKTHLYSFATVYESVVAYSKSLNVNPYYRKFRKERARMAKSVKIDSVALANCLESYSENKRYSQLVRQLIRDYDLTSMDEMV